MSTQQPTAGSIISEQQAGQVGGGACSAEELRQVLQDIKSSYETLVDFVSHVIERVDGGPGTAP